MGADGLGAGQPYAATSSTTTTTTTTMASYQPVSKFDSHPYDGPINFDALFWVDRGPGIWALQTTIAVICFIEAILMQYLTYKVSAGEGATFHTLQCSL